ncbi:MAG: RodZ domain-containing protein [Novosphingobium sp.]
MAEQDLQLPQVPTDETISVGARLRRAREALKLSRTDIAARTKIAERHLAAIEAERYGDLASSTYAVGFSRAYARAVGLDEREIAQAVRDELNTAEEVAAPAKTTFEPGDPARVPSSRTAWLAGGAALTVLAGVGVFWGSYIFPAASLPDLIRDAPPPPAPTAAAPTPAPAAAATPQGQVVITATQAGVWVKVTDEAGKQLFQKEMALGERYAVPLDAAGPKLRTAWPDALAITIGDSPVAPLADRRTVITVPISAQALLARGAPPPAARSTPVQAAPVQAAPVQPAPPQSAPQPAPRPTSANVPAAAPSPAQRPAAAPTAKPAAPVARPSPAPSPTKAVPTTAVPPSARPTAAAMADADPVPPAPAPEAPAEPAEPPKTSPASP